MTEGATVEQMLKQYEKEHNFPSITEETKDMIILVNESLSKLSNELKDDDIVRVFEPCCGG
ncbi:MAG: MoaD/ThiS family protein [Leptospirales bacterium]|nr:MoaD/ThiS family protein [Leptospirales bacterium]